MRPDLNATLRPPRLSPVSYAALILHVTIATFAVELKDGLKLEVLNSIDCTRKTKSGDGIHMHYRGTLEDGTVFDSSYERGDPLRFTLGQGEVIKGWDEGLLDMCVGEERKLTIPPDLAYGDRDMGEIPPNSMLVFETKLVSIDGVASEPVEPEEELKNPEPPHQDPPTVLPPNPNAATTTGNVPSTNSEEQEESDNGECKLLGDFALIVQAALGLLAVLSLVWKRYRERPRRPIKVWSFDASKQVVGSVLLHGANLLMSMLSAGSYEIASSAKKMKDEAGHQPNPCSFYLINIAVDTTIGIPILVIILRALHAITALTPLARPPESIKSGHYGHPPKATWWMKQSIIYFIGLLLMKLCVLLIFMVLPWIAWVGDWALRWTEGSEALQIAFVMFVFPLIMNALQYYIIDSFIKDPSGGDHEALATSSSDADDSDGSRRLLGDSGSYDGGSFDSQRNSEDQKRSSNAQNPTSQEQASTPEMKGVEMMGDRHSQDDGGHEEASSAEIAGHSQKVEP